MTMFCPLDYKKVSPTYLNHRWGWGSADGLNFKLFHEQVVNERANGGFHTSAMDLFKILTLDEEVGVFKPKPQQGDDFLELK